MPDYITKLLTSKSEFCFSIPIVCKFRDFILIYIAFQTFNKTLTTPAVCANATMYLWDCKYYVTVLQLEYNGGPWNKPDVTNR